MEPTPSNDALSQAIEHHRAGRLTEAEKLYRVALQQLPNRADIHNNLGAVLLAAGKMDAALVSLDQAITLSPNYSAPHNNRAILLRRRGRIDESIASCRRAIQIEPNFANAFNSLSLAWEAKGDLDQAMAAAQRVVELQPTSAQAHARVGSIYHTQKKWDQAIHFHRRAAELDPTQAAFRADLGTSLSGRGEWEQSIAAFQRAIEMEPLNSDFHMKLAVAYLAHEDTDLAISASCRSIQLRPDSPDGYSVLSMALIRVSRFDEAIAACRKVVSLKPDFAEAYNVMGAALHQKGDADASVAACQKAISIRPDFADAYNNLGVAFLDRDELELGIAALRRGIELAPNDFNPHINLGGALIRCGQIDEGLESFSRAITLNPKLTAPHSNRVYSMHFNPNADAGKLLEENRLWAKQHEEPLLNQIKVHVNDRSPNRRLRIGYFSPYFWSQAESHFMVPMLEHHDHQNFEIYCYSSSTRRDAVTDRFRPCADVWRDIYALSDDQTADLIRRDQIDILIDLAMHMADNRILILARKPAPIQIAYLAYPGSTGMKSMDYILSDSHMDPPGAAWSLYVEKPIRLPDCWCVYSPLCDIPPLRSRGSGPICFGSLNNPCKHNDPLLRLWARVLRAVADSRLILQTISQVQRKHILSLFAGEGIAGGRIEFVGRMPRTDYLRMYDRIDICLDPLPYNGITTTCDALWMGAPVVSLAGKTSAGRAGGSILRTAGLPELATETEEQFVQVATQLAMDLPRLIELRRTLRQRFEQSPMMDAARFMRNVEAAYRQIWRSWCESKEC